MMTMSSSWLWVSAATASIAFLVAAAAILSAWATRAVPNEMRAKHSRRDLVRLLRHAALADLSAAEASVVQEFRRRTRLAHVPVGILLGVTLLAIVAWAVLSALDAADSTR
jgi:hypothetical protein